MVPFDGERLQRAMRARGMDVVLATSRHNVSYLTGGYYNPFFGRESQFGRGQYLAAVAVPAGRLDSAFYVGRDNELDFLQAFGPLWISDIYWAPRRPNMTVEVAATAADALRRRGHANGAVGVELPFLPADAFEVLRRDLPGATFADASPVLAELRAVKRPAEIERLEAVHRITAEAIRAVLIDGRPDLSMRDVAAAVRHQLETRDAAYLYALTNVGPGLVRAATSEPWGRGRPLHVDAGAELDGYRSDVARMGSIGSAPARAREMFDGCVAAQATIRRSISAGLPCGELWRIGADAVSAGPWGRLGKFQAHGLGLVSHEPPEITEEATGILEPGMVVSVETDVLDPDTGHIKLEDTVVVTATGCEAIGDVHREWCVAAGHSCGPHSPGAAGPERIAGTAPGIPREAGAGIGGMRTSTAVEEPQAFARALGSSAGRIATSWAARLAAVPAFATRDGASLQTACAAHLHALARWLHSADDDELRRGVVAQTQACIQTGLALADAVHAYATLEDLLWEELGRETAGTGGPMATARRLSAGLGVTIRAVAAEYQRATASRLALQREEQEQLALRLERTQVRDAATDAYTRAYCLDVLDREARLAHRYAYPLSLLVIDVDDFDGVTVGLGSAERDDVLRSLAGHFVSAVREVDLVCRLGHDIFGVILSHIPAGVAAGVAERLRLTVEDWTPSLGDVQLDRRATISVGVAGFPDDAATADELLLRAEAARTHAKRAGKNTVVSARDLPA